jgi:hypothetical protein
MTHNSLLAQLDRALFFGTDGAEFDSPEAFVQRPKYATCWQGCSAFVVVDFHKGGISIMLGPNPEAHAIIVEYKRRKLAERRQEKRRVAKEFPSGG